MRIRLDEPWHRTRERASDYHTKVGCDVERGPQHRCANRRIVQPIAGRCHGLHERNEPGMCDRVPANEIVVLVRVVDVTVEVHRPQRCETLDLVARIYSRCEQRQRDDSCQTQRPPFLPPATTTSDPSRPHGLSVSVRRKMVVVLSTVPCSHRVQSGPEQVSTNRSRFHHYAPRRSPVEPLSTSAYTLSKSTTAAVHEKSCATIDRLSVPIAASRAESESASRMASAS